MTLIELLKQALLGPQNARLLRISFPHDDAPSALLLPNKLEGFECLSKEFRYTVELLSDDASIALDEVIGKLICVSLVRSDGQLRPFTGYVSSFRFVKTDGGVAFYEAVLVPWLQHLELRRNDRLFHDQTIKEQMQEIFAEYGALPQWKWNAQGENIRFTMARQCAETDRNYIARRLEAEGRIYRYEHTAKGHELLVEGDSYSVPPIDGLLPTIRFHAKGGPQDEDAIAHWRPARHWASGGMAVSGFDFKRPTAEHTAIPTVNRQGDVPALEVHHYQGHYGFRPAASARAVADLRMKEIEARAMQFLAEGNCTRVAAGRWFKLTDHFDHRGEDAEFLILEVQHVATNNYLQATGEVAEYKNRLVCQPRSVPWHPGIGFNSVPVKLLELQTAIVVGSEGQGSLNVDEYGRIEVRFHWDRSPDSKSCRLRVASSWAGGENGMPSHPRVGSEVVVQALDGCPDHLLVTGCVHNQHYMPPWKLPEQAALTGLRSRELAGNGGNSPGGRSNHLVLDDTAGRMQVQLKSDHQTSQLSLGSITRIEDTAGRKDPRGQGFELRTDGLGTVRAQDGLLISTEGRPNAQAHISDMAETTQRLIDGHDQHERLSKAAQDANAHTTGDQDEVVKSIKKQNDAIKGDHGNPEEGKFPEFQSPHLVLSSPVGIESTTEGSTHIASTEHTALTSGGHISLSTSKSLLASAKEAVRMFAYKAGMKLVAASADIDISALKDSVNVLAKLNITHTANKITIKAVEEVEIVGGTSFSKWNAAGIEHGTDGAWIEQAASHSMNGPANAPAPTLVPIEVALKETPPEREVAFAMQAVPGVPTALLAKQPYTLFKNGGEYRKGKFDEHGRLSVEKVEKGDRYQVKLFNGTVHDMPVAQERMETDPAHPDFHEHQLSNKGLRADGQTADQRLAQQERGTV